MGRDVLRTLELRDQAHVHRLKLQMTWLDLVKTEDAILRSSLRCQKHSYQIQWMNKEPFWSLSVPHRDTLMDTQKCYDPDPLMDWAMFTRCSSRPQHIFYDQDVYTILETMKAKGRTLRLPEIELPDQKKCQDLHAQKRAVLTPYLEAKSFGSMETGRKMSLARAAEVKKVRETIIKNLREHEGLISQSDQDNWSELALNLGNLFVLHVSWYFMETCDIDQTPQLDRRFVTKPEQNSMVHRNYNIYLKSSKGEGFGLESKNRILCLSERWIKQLGEFPPVGTAIEPEELGITIANWLRPLMIEAFAQATLEAIPEGHESF